MLDHTTTGDSVSVADILQQVAEHKGCGTSAASGKASCGSGAGENDMDQSGFLSNEKE